MLRVLAGAGLTAGLVGGALAVPVPAVIVSTGKAVIKVEDGCLARVVRDAYKKAVPASGRMELPVGTYKLKVRPDSCLTSKKKITIRKGRTTKATVTAESPLAPTTSPSSGV